MVFPKFFLCSSLGRTITGAMKWDELGSNLPSPPHLWVNYLPLDHLLSKEWSNKYQRAGWSLYIPYTAHCIHQTYHTTHQTTYKDTPAHIPTATQITYVKYAVLYTPHCTLQHTSPHSTSSTIHTPHHRTSHTPHTLHTPTINTIPCKNITLYYAHPHIDTLVSLACTGREPVHCENLCQASEEPTRTRAYGRIGRTLCHWVAKCDDIPGFSEQNRLGLSQLGGGTP